MDNLGVKIQQVETEDNQLIQVYEVSKMLFHTCVQKHFGAQAQSSTEEPLSFTKKPGITE